MENSRGRKQIRLTVFDNEPLARMAEQRLHVDGIRCVVRSLGAGPGGWGVATYLHHAIYVNSPDEMRARHVLDLPPAEIEERDDIPRSTHRVSITIVIVLVITLAVLLFGTLELLIEGIIH